MELLSLTRSSPSSKALLGRSWRPAAHIYIRSGFFLTVSLKEEKKPPPPVPKKPAKSKSQLSRDKGSDSDKQRQEARKRLMAAKRAASVRQNSATESADSIEIYVPEAQTRL